MVQLRIGIWYDASQGFKVVGGAQLSNGQGAPDKSERRPVSDAEACVFEKEEVPYATRCEHRLHFLCPNDAEGDRFDVYQAAQCTEMAIVGR